MGLNTKPESTQLLLSVGACLLVTMVWAGASWADDPVPIGAILADPDRYHLRHVTFRGTVRDVVQLDPYFQTTEAAGVVCYGAYAFRVEDETGTIEVGVLGFCGVPVIRQPAVANGERVRVTAQIHAPGRTGSFLDLLGHFIASGDSHVRAIASYLAKPDD